MHLEDQNLTEREAIQLAKEFAAKRVPDVEFYMGMIMDDQQTFDGLVNHLKMHFSQGDHQQISQQFLQSAPEEK